MILNWSSSFKRAYRKIVKNNPSVQSKILTAMKLLETDPFHPQLKSHKLQGILEGNWACSAAYDLRIIYSFVNNPKTGEIEILLIDIGTHEEVY